MFFGAAIRGLRGVIERASLCITIPELEAKVQAGLYAGLSAPDAFAARQRLLAAEVAARLQQEAHSRADVIRLLKEAVGLMEEDLKAVESDLAAHPATKLDVAQLVVSMRRLTLSTLEQLHAFEDDVKEDIATQVDAAGKRLMAHLEQLDFEQARQKRCLGYLTVALVASIALAVFALLR